MSKTITKLTDDALNNVNGGFIFDATDVSGADKDNPWEVIDSETGETLARCPNENAAKKKAKELKKNYLKISWEDLCILRDQNN